MPLRRWLRHTRNLQGFFSVWPGGGLRNALQVAPWLSDTVQLTTEVLPPLRQVSLATPAANTEFTQSVPGLETWRLVCLQVLLTTDANAANRIFRLNLVDENGNIVFHGQANLSQPASTATVYQCAAIGADSANLLSTFHSMLIPFKFQMPAGYLVRSDTLNMQAGDQYSGIHLLFEVWPGP